MNASLRARTAPSLLLPLALALGPLPSHAGEPTNPLEGNPQAIEAGRSIFNNTCLFCHGAKGKGARAPSLVTGHYKPGGANSDAYMFDVISNGRPGTIMGAFGESHSAEEIWQVIAYLRQEARDHAAGIE